MEITADISSRKIFFDSRELQLSNYDIKHLREISGKESFGNRELEEAVRKVVEKQVEPFLKDARKKANDQNILKEMEESFHTHVFLFLHEKTR